MVGPLLRLRWIAGHVLVVAALVAFVSLGFWQLRRLDEKRAFNVAVSAGIDGSAVWIGAAGLDPYLRVSGSGEYVGTAQALILRSRNGVSGHHVLTPLDLGDGTGVLVDRGWVPITIDDPVLALPTSGRVSVEGVLWPAQDAGDAELAAVVPRIDPDLFSMAAGVALDDRYLVLLEQDPPGEPIAEAPPALPEGPHLGYAVQWFLFAAVVGVGYPFVLRRALTD